MLQQQANKPKKNIDRTLITEINQTGLLLSNLVKQQELSNAMVNLAAKKLDLSLEILTINVVFLSNKKSTDSITKVLKWLGITEKSDQEKLFKSPIITSVSNNTTVKLIVNTSHFDYFLEPSSIWSSKYDFSIIVFDPSYVNTYEHSQLAIEMLSENSTVVFQVVLSEKGLNNQSFKPFPIRANYGRLLNVEQLGLSVRELLNDKNLVPFLNNVRLKHYVSHLKNVYTFVSNNLSYKEKQWEGKFIINHKKQLNIKTKDFELSSKETGFLKSKIDSDFKKIVRYIDEKIDNFENEEQEYNVIAEDIQSFLGFVENRNAKSLVLKISDGAVKERTRKTDALLNHFFKKTTSKTKVLLKTLETGIIKHFKAWELGTLDFKIPEIKDNFSQEIIASNTLVYDKNYEKQVPYKGIGSLVMELRTPLFMLMPFMMIFALFGALVGSEDKGNIDESILFHNNRPAIAINKLPEFRNSEFRHFINDLEDIRGKKRSFDKEISIELVSEPQLAIKTVEVAKNYGDKTKIVETLDYAYDNKEQVLFVYLKQNADRNFVINTFFNPNLQLLNSSSSGRSSFGIGGLIRAMKSQGVKDFRFLILVSLVGLILWFIITRKKAMDKELQSAKDKEQKKLNLDLKQTLDKSTRLNLQKWKTKMYDELNSRQTTALKAADNFVNLSIHNRKRDRLEQQKIIQKRLGAIKAEKAKLNTLKSEKQKLKTKLEQIALKLKRLERA